MAKFMLGTSPWTVTINREVIDVTSSHPTPNESWRFTDGNSHEHRWRNGYPTLRLVIDASHWCDGTEGFARHDPHVQEDEWHYECLLCGEVIAPAMDPPFTPKSIPGAVDARIVGPRSDGTVISAWLTEDEAKAVCADPENPAALQALADSIPDERITSVTFASR